MRLRQSELPKPLCKFPIVNEGCRKGMILMRHPRHHWPIDESD